MRLILFSVFPLLIAFSTAQAKTIDLRGKSISAVSLSRNLICSGSFCDWSSPVPVLFFYYIGKSGSIYMYGGNKNSTNGKKIEFGQVFERDGIIMSFTNEDNKFVSHLKFSSGEFVQNIVNLELNGRCFVSINRYVDYVKDTKYTVNKCEWRDGNIFSDGKYFKQRYFSEEDWKR